MTHVDHRLRNAWEGALAGGGDPATSPLYVFGPFLVLLASGGVTGVSFGASIYLVVLTIGTVSALYRLVMRWITDGSGGTGLTEEEFGPWAAKVNAGITFIEYSLTFLVSVAALVTFLADRAPRLNGVAGGLQFRTWVAIGLSVMCGWLVNRGPRIAAAVFGPATAAVLALLWVLNVAVVARNGLHLPAFDLRAFDGSHLRLTLGGFVRILAVMTGVEVFANLVAAYEGPPVERSRKAFGSLAIIMVSTSVTMLLLGPAVVRFADPNDPDVSVFTQTMDALLPRPLALAGTAVGVAVLLSAAAASALGIQSLFAGMGHRHFVPAALTQVNPRGVVTGPVWLEVAMVALAFALLGSEEATYLAVYAAGVFVLLSMTAWAAVARLVRTRGGDGQHRWELVIAAVAAVLTSAATVVILVERFSEGVWTYLVMVPVLFCGFTVVRRLRGDPGAAADRMGAIAASWPGSITWTGGDTDGLPIEARVAGAIIVPLDGSRHAEQCLPHVHKLAEGQLHTVHLLHVRHEDALGDAASLYLETIAAGLGEGCEVVVTTAVTTGEPVEEILAFAGRIDADVIMMGTRGTSGLRRVVIGSVASRVSRQAGVPVVLVDASARTGPGRAESASAG